jgi:hypothetical protein
MKKLAALAFAAATFASTPALAEFQEGWVLLPGQTFHKGPPSIMENDMGKGPLFQSDKPRMTQVHIHCRNDAAQSIEVFYVPDDIMQLARDMFSDSAKGIVTENNGATRYEYIQEPDGRFVPLFTPDKNNQVYKDILSNKKQVMRDGKLDLDTVRALAASTCKPPMS